MNHDHAIAAALVLALVGALVAVGSPLPAAIGKQFAARPATPVCQDAGNLIGFHWNWNTWQEEMRLINTCTGKSKLIGIVKDLEFFSWAATAIDHSRDIVYIGGRTLGSSIPRLFAIDTQTWSTNYITLDRYNTGNYQVRNDGTLVAFYFEPSTQQEELRSIDAATGSTSLIGVIPGIYGLSVNLHPIDPSTNIIYQEGTRQGDPREYIFKVDADDASTSTVVLDRDFTVLEIRSDGVLVGLTWNGNQEELRSIDPSNGQSSFLGIVPNMEKLSGLVRAYDVGRDRLYQKGKIFNDPNTERIFVINGHTGSAYYFTPDKEFDILHVV